MFVVDVDLVLSRRIFAEVSLLIRPVGNKLLGGSSGSLTESTAHEYNTLKFMWSLDTEHATYTEDKWPTI